MDNRNGPSILLSISLLPNKDIKIQNPVCHLVICRIPIAVFQNCACVYLSTMTLRASPANVFPGKDAHPAGLAWIFSFHAQFCIGLSCNMGWVFLLFFELSHFTSNSEHNVWLCCPHYYLLILQSFCHPQIF